MLSNVDLRPYLLWAFEATAPQVRLWLGDDAVRAAIRADLEEAISGETEEDLNAYTESCPCERATPFDYGLRELELGSDLSVLARIHFRSLDIDWPFVGVLVQTRSLHHVEIQEVVDELSREFAPFRPRFIGFWAAGSDQDLRNFPGAVGDQRVIAGWIPDILERRRPSSPERVHLELDSDAGCYEEYVAIYTEFFDSHPEWRGRLVVEDHETLLACARQGALHRVHVDGAFAGVVAARSGGLGSLNGWEMVDELLAKPFRGRSLAPVLQRLFLEKLDVGVHQIVFGTIDEDNLPSLRTALRVGRVDVGGWFFVPAR